MFLVGKIRKETIKQAELDAITGQENKLMDSIKKLNKVSAYSYVNSYNFRPSKNVFVKLKKNENVVKRKNANDLLKRNGVSSKRKKIVENELKWKNNEKSRKLKGLLRKRLDKKWKKNWLVKNKLTEV